MKMRMNNNALRKSRALKREADVVLKQLNLVPLLSRYGRATFTGSYFYDLMTWRDIDLCLTVPHPTMDTAGKIVRDMSSLRALATVYVRNELVLKTQGNPSAIFVCTEFRPRPKTTWKIDILIGSEDIVKRTIEPGREMMRDLTIETRERIIALKSHLCTQPSYRQEVRSTDIYRAVMEDGVKNLSEWDQWKAHRK